MEKKGRLLIVDDNEDVLFALNLLLTPYMEKIKTTTEPEKIPYYMDTFNPDVFLLDMNFSRDAIGGEEGFDILKQILERDSEAVVLFMTAYADTEKAVRAIKAGATDFVPKPWEKDKLLATVSSAVKLRLSRCEVKELRERVATLSSESGAPCMIGRSGPMLKVIDTIERIAGTDANVLILGENGTGKDVAAHLLRYQSLRREQPFVSIDVGSIPETLFESELFGFEKGAFTDAHHSKAGRMEVANGGTLFLDEIGNLSPAMQSKLLAALERRTICRIGSTREIPVDIRLISATNADIRREVENGRFRQDLLYRINTVELHIPPLRERGEDILLLAEFFKSRFARKYRKEITRISREAGKKLLRYHWPGNVRELQHAIERAVIMADGPSLSPTDFTLEHASKDEAINEDLTETTLNLEMLERKAIEKAVRLSEGNLTKAAAWLGITRFALYRKISKLGL